MPQQRRRRRWSQDKIEIVFIGLGVVVIGAVSAVVSFGHVRDLANAHGASRELGPIGGIATAVVIEWASIVAYIMLRRSRRKGHHTGFAAWVMVVTAALSLGAQLVQAERTFLGYVVAAVPTLGFLTMVKFLLMALSMIGVPETAGQDSRTGQVSGQAAGQVTGHPGGQGARVSGPMVSPVPVSAPAPLSAPPPVVSRPAPASLSTWPRPAPALSTSGGYAANGHTANGHTPPPPSTWTPAPPLPPPMSHLSGPPTPAPRTAPPPPVSPPVSAPVVRAARTPDRTAPVDRTTDTGQAAKVDSPRARIVSDLSSDPDLSKLSDTELAGRYEVSVKTVQRARRDVRGS